MWRIWEQQGGRRSLLNTRTKQKTGRRCEPFWDGSTKIDGRSGCSVVIKVVDRDKWITISKIAVFLRMCTVMASEVVVVSVLLGILDLVRRQPLA